MLAEIPTAQFAEVLDRVVDDVLAEADWSHASVDAVKVARRLGLRIVVDAGQAARARCLRVSTQPSGPVAPAIFLRPDPRPERLQWAVAHEIGEHVAHRVFDRLDVDPVEAPPAARERVANLLAGRLLLPTRSLQRDAEASDWDLLELKSLHPTASHELIARRMLDLPPPAVMAVFDNGALTWRHGNRPGIRGLTELEDHCRRTAHATAQPQRATADDVAVQAWPVHEPEWKREITRLSWSDFD